MKKALDITQQIIISSLQAAVLTLIILGVMMAATSCSPSKGIKVHKKGSSYSKKNVYRVSNKSKGRCVGGTCYAF